MAVVPDERLLSDVESDEAPHIVPELTVPVYFTNELPDQSVPGSEQQKYMPNENVRHLNAPAQIWNGTSHSTDFLRKKRKMNDSRCGFQTSP